MVINQLPLLIYPHSGSELELPDNDLCTQIICESINNLKHLFTSQTHMKYTEYNYTEHFQTLIKLCTNLQQNIRPDRIVINLLQLT